MTNNNWQELYLESVKGRALLEREIDELRSQRDAYQKRFEKLKDDYFKLKDDKCKDLWSNGHPQKGFPGWFIAVLDTGERVVLKALSDENSYDYTTADLAYYKSYKVKKWMQFPDSDFLPWGSAND